MSFLVHRNPASMAFDGDLFTFLEKKLTMTFTIPLMARPHGETTRSENATAGRLVGSITSRALF